MANLENADIKWLNKIRPHTRMVSNEQIGLAVAGSIHETLQYLTLLTSVREVPFRYPSNETILPWNGRKAYNIGDRVSIGGFIYEALVRINAVDILEVPNIINVAPNNNEDNTRDIATMSWVLLDSGNFYRLPCDGYMFVRILDIRAKDNSFILEKRLTQDNNVGDGFGTWDVPEELLESRVIQSEKPILIQYCFTTLIDAPEAPKFVYDRFAETIVQGALMRLPPDGLVGKNPNYHMQLYRKMLNEEFTKLDSGRPVAARHNSDAFGLNNYGHFDQYYGGTFSNPPGNPQRG